ncbi:MAG: Phenolic acid decarboxylase subunit C [Syntrophorhabdaceae bacterium PtaU1.Bin034]|jgi:2,5-furandicarboxylate decarboxylase 1|nr:MAG: Phenolic acid decarboxylase subunit C [Syntrophorhabdaceae bacterium PtaU1.Bin034]
MEGVREYVGFMNARGLVLEIEDTVPRADIPALIDLLSDRERVLLFRRVEGYKCSVVANLVPSHDALSVALGSGDSYKTFLDGIKKRQKKIPVEREDLETVDMTERDLLSVLPILKHYEGDSAPFITTGVVSSKDPDTGIAGRGVHRMEYRGANRLGVTLLNPPLSDIFARYKAKGQPMPLTVTLGVDPVMFLSMALKAGPDTDKLEIAGGLKGKGIKVMASLDSSIDVPAGAEFYLEGYVDPDDRRRDGPLGEISGYYMTIEETPTMVVKKLSHRVSPLYHALLPTSREGDAYLTFVSRAHVEDNVKKLFPFIQDLSFVRGTFGSSVVVSVGPAESTKIRSLVLSMMAFPMIKKVTVVDVDVDPHDLRDVEWAVVTRCMADRDVIIIPALQGQPIDPSASEGHGVTKMGIDATTQGKNIEPRARIAAGNRTGIERIVRHIGGVE